MAELWAIPNEILEYLFRFLCSHCFDHGPVSSKQGLLALSALSQTCSRFRDIAQPILFHYLDPYGKNPVPLLRNLLARPDLAANIQEAYIGAQWDIGTGLSSEDVDFCDKTMSKFFRQDGSPFTVSPRWFVFEYGQRSRDVLFVSQPEAALCAIAMTLIPNVQTLVIELGYFWRFPFCLPGSLPQLTELNFRHADSELGQDMLDVEELLAAATNLKLLNCYMLSRVSGDFFHQNVVELNLTNSHLAADFFLAILTGLPKLSIFTYESGGPLISEGAEAYPLEISHALLLRARTLQHVAINLDDAKHIGGIGPTDVMESLKEMRRLKCLVVPSRSIYGDGEPSDTRSRLIDFLPKSIEHLTIEYMPVNKMRDLMELGKVAATRFPSLRQLQVPGIGRAQVAKLATVFSQTKIDGTFVGDTMNWRQQIARTRRSYLSMKQGEKPAVYL